MNHGRNLWSPRTQTLWLFPAIVQTLQSFYSPLYTFISSTYDSSSRKWCLTSHKRLQIPSFPASPPGENTVYRIYTFANIVACLDCRNCSKTAGKVWELSLSPLRSSTLCLLCVGVISSVIPMDFDISQYDFSKDWDRFSGYLQLLRSFSAHFNWLLAQPPARRLHFVINVEFT